MRRRTPRLRPAETPAKRKQSKEEPSSLLTVKLPSGKRVGPGGMAKGTTRTVTKKADIAAGAKALFTKSAAKKAGSAYLDLLWKTSPPGLARMLGQKVKKHVRGEKSPEKKNKK